MRSLARRLALTLVVGLGCDRSGSSSGTPLPPPPPVEDTAVAPSAVASASAAIAPPPDASASAPPEAGLGPGFPTAGPWVSFYGNARQMKDVARVAKTYRVINIDADPAMTNFTDAQLKALKAGGKNRVLSYMNVGACEHYRSYWRSVPRGFVSCSANRAGQLGAYDGYPDETWMNPSSADYQKLIVEHVAARIAARGVDGFYLDNLELLGHPDSGKNGPCDAACKKGGLELVKKLRDKFPDLLIVMQNGTSDVTRLGVVDGIAFPRLLDGVAHEEVWAPHPDPVAEKEMLAWKAMGLKTRSGAPFWLAVEDYVGSCANEKSAAKSYAKAREHGLSMYVTDESGGQRVVCYWPESVTK